MRQGIKDSAVTADTYDEAELAMPETAPCYWTAASIRAFPIKPSFCALQ